MLLLKQSGFRSPVVFVITFKTVSILVLVIASYHLALGQLVVLSECVCPGRELRLECTVVGIGSTVWSGTAFDCPERGNEILLRHSQFESGGAVGECNNGMIIGHFHNRTFDGLNSKYTSQLTIQLPSLNATNNTLEGKTVECIYDNGTMVTVIDTHKIAYMRDVPSPDNIHLAQISKNELVFQWDPVQSVCPDSEYKVNAMNCGMCPDAIFTTFLTCIVNKAFNSMCTLSVETIVCGTNSGNKSETITAVLKAPGPPTISSVLPYYYSGSGELIKVDVEIKSDSIERFNISDSDGIDGSVTSYTFNISFLDSGTDCSGSLATLPLSSCEDGVCTITLANLTSLPCYKHPSQAEVAVYASNVLTDGPPSTTSLNTSNNLLFVQFESFNNSFSCQFIGNYENKSCEITYGAMDPTNQSCYLDKKVSHMNSSDNFMLDRVIVHIPSLAQTKSNLFCFKAVGTTSMFTIVVEGTFTIGTSLNSNTNSNFAVALILLCVTILLILLALIAALSVVLIRKAQCDCGLHQAEHEQQHCEISMSFTTQPQSRQPVTDQQTVYSEVTPLSLNGNSISFVLRDDDKVEYAQLNHQHSHASNPTKTPTTHLAVPEASIFEAIDNSLTLDSLLIQLRPQVAPIWYKFGLALGIPKDTLSTYVGYPDEDCIVEVLDYWLRNCKSKPTWRDVVETLKDVELYQLADGILNVYKTGKLPVEVDMEALPQELLDSKLDTESIQDSPPPLPPKQSAFQQ